MVKVWPLIKDQLLYDAMKSSSQIRGSVRSVRSNNVACFKKWGEVDFGHHSCKVPVGIPINHTLRTVLEVRATG